MRTNPNRKFSLLFSFAHTTAAAATAKAMVATMTAVAAATTVAAEHQPNTQQAQHTDECDTMNRKWKKKSLQNFSFSNAHECVQRECVCAVCVCVMVFGRVHTYMCCFHSTNIHIISIRNRMVHSYCVCECKKLTVQPTGFSVLQPTSQPNDPSIHPYKHIAANRLGVRCSLVTLYTYSIAW